MLTGWHPKILYLTENSTSDNAWLVFIQDASRTISCLNHKPTHTFSSREMNILSLLLFEVKKLHALLVLKILNHYLYMRQPNFCHENA